MNQILLSGTLHESLVNGEGMRHVLFAQICYHHCEGCFNPETHSPLGGKWVDLEDIIHTINTNPLLSGVTFSGGDPFEQAEGFAYIADHVKKPDFDIWCYTGYTYEYLLEHQNSTNHWKDLMDRIDVLVDGRYDYLLADPNLKYRGSSNQRIIDVKASKKNHHIILKDY